MLTAIIFIIVIGVLVLVHEFGHFIFAKRAGMKVEEFGFGFPPRLWGFKRGETTYSLNWIPFGGFVKILGEDGDERGPRSFASAPFGKRMVVIVAGVAMNFLLAALLLVFVNFMGMRIGLLDDNSQAARDTYVQVIDVADDSPAAAAGLQPLDILSGYVEGADIKSFNTAGEVQSVIASHLGQPLTLQIGRGDQITQKIVTPRENPPEGQGALGISLVRTGVVSYPWHEAVWRGVYDAVLLTYHTIVAYYQLLKTLVVHGTLMAEVSGPIGIASLTGQAAQVGFNYLLQFVAIISINLAVLNIIPFPALDGGRAVILLIEKAKGSPVHKKAEGLTNMIGFYLLVLLMLYVTYKDISKFFYK